MTGVFLPVNQEISWEKNCYIILHECLKDSTSWGSVEYAQNKKRLSNSSDGKIKSKEKKKINFF